ncbi:MAG: hypothetical protein Q8O46_00955 [bacterium]|nr:hypothetical protein [bacterium]
MESKPKDSLQIRFKDGPESIKVGNKLKYINEDGGYFVNQFGFRIDTIPVGTRIKTAGFGIGMGLNMPESQGRIVFKDGQTFFNHEEEFPDKIHYREYKFFNGDIVEVIALPS